MAGNGPFVGHSVPRLEDAPLVVGQGRFAADISFAHQAHMRVVRSAHAHGRIVAIDSAAAVSMDADARPSRIRSPAAMR